MERNENIVWIASYPKSGNTWIRSILASLFFSKNGNFDFDLIKKIDQFDIEKHYQFVKKRDLNEYQKLTKMNIVSKYWTEAQKQFGSTNKTFFFKTHSANYNFNNIKYASKETTKGCIYVIRDPRDVVISYAKFIGSSIDEAIQSIIFEKSKIYSPNKKIGIILSRWDYHVASWINLNKPTIIIRYEDLLTNTRKIVGQLIVFLKKNLNLEFDCDDIKLNNILESTNFNKLKEIERKIGFEEASKNTPFFRSGQSNEWEKILNQNQKNIVQDNFEEYMKKFKYL